MLNKFEQEILKNILDQKDKIIYLASAEISMDPPSSLSPASPFSCIFLNLGAPEKDIKTNNPIKNSIFDIK